MPFDRPTLTALQNLAAQDVNASLPGADALLRFSNLGVLSRVQAGMTHLHYGYLDWIAKQAIPYTASGEFLEAWSALKGVTRKPATQAGSPVTGQVTFSGTVGTLIPAGTGMLRGDGIAYTSTADATVSGGGTAVVNAMADADPQGLTGAAGNCATGVAITLATVIPGVQSTGSVTRAFAGGADLESDDSLRTRMLAAFQQVPQGGAIADYLQWALAVSGVTRSWCNPNGAGAGTVVVYTMFDQTEAAFAGFPQGTDGVATADTRASAATGDQLTVANSIFPKQPVTALIYSVAPLPTAVNFTIGGLSGASVATKALIAAAISGVFYLYGTPLGGSIALSLVESAIAAIAGTTGFLITTPSGNISTTLGHLPTLGTVTYT